MNDIQRLLHCMEDKAFLDYINEIDPSNVSYEMADALVRELVDRLSRCVKEDNK